ncbi:unnamed protein product [Peniophora sp. CBMAI 1063]|nr:unnamed protein product [Peniophora sp. CBMAI 1063]
MADDIPHANEVFRLRSMFMVMFKASHNKMEIMNPISSMAIYSLPDNDPLRRHLLAEMASFTEAQYAVESDLLPEDEFYNRMELLFRAVQATLAPGGAFLTQISEPHFERLAPAKARERRTEWLERETKLRVQLEKSSFKDWHTSAARRLAQDAKTKEEREEAREKRSRRKKAKKVKSSAVDAPSHEATIVASVVNDDGPVVPSESQDPAPPNWLTPPYATPTQRTSAAPSHSYDYHEASGFRYDEYAGNNDPFASAYDNTHAAVSSTTHRQELALNPRFTPNFASFSDNNHHGAYIPPTSWSPGSLRTSDPHEFRDAHAMQWSPDEDMIIDNLTGRPQGQATLSRPVEHDWRVTPANLSPRLSPSYYNHSDLPSSDIQSPFFDHSLATAPSTSLSHGWEQQDARLFDDKLRGDHWEPYSSGTSQHYHPDTSQPRGHMVLQQQQSAPRFNAMEYGYPMGGSNFSGYAYQAARMR